MHLGPTSFRLFFSAALVALFAGCGGPKVPEYETVPVSGTVKLNGAPLADADVAFIFDGDPAPKNYFGSAGKTDASGKYELLTNNQKGCVEGKFKVVISKYTDPQGNVIKIDPESGMDLEQLKQQGQAIESIPPNYSNLDTTTLSAEVTTGKAEGYDFELTK